MADCRKDDVKDNHKGDVKALANGRGVTKKVWQRTHLVSPNYT